MTLRFSLYGRSACLQGSMIWDLPLFSSNLVAIVSLKCICSFPTEGMVSKSRHRCSQGMVDRSLCCSSLLPARRLFQVCLLLCAVFCGQPTPRKIRRGRVATSVLWQERRGIENALANSKAECLMVKPTSMTRHGFVGLRFRADAPMSQDIPQCHSPFVRTLWNGVVSLPSNADLQLTLLHIV